MTENGAAYDDIVVVDEGATRVHDADRTEFLRLHLGAVNANEYARIIATRSL